MSPSRPTSNVYVLPPLMTAAPTARTRPSLPIRLRCLAWWWRLRLTAREVTDALRRFGRPKARAERNPFEADAGTIVPVEPRRSAGPAQIIEFAAVRRRRSAR